MKTLTLILIFFLIELVTCDTGDDKYSLNHDENVIDTTNYERARSAVDFTGKVVLVTGSNSGIGAETVRLLAYLGAQVVVTGRNVSRIREVGRQCWLLSPYKLRPLEVVADLTDYNQVLRLYYQTINAFNRLDLLVNNAGIVLNSRVIDSNFSMAYYNLTQLYNIAAIQLTQLFIPHLNRTNGSIIFIETESINHPGIGDGSYDLAKTAIIGLRQTLCVELGPNIRVNSIRPGAILNTNILRYYDANTIMQTQESFIIRATHTALRRSGEPIDIAYAVVILASPLAQFITGQYIRVDGGYYTTL